MVFEEFAGQIQLQKMLKFLDPYPMALEVKGGMRPAMYETVIITSNTRPDGWYRDEQEGGQEDGRTPCTLGQAWLQEREQHHLQNLRDLPGACSAWSNNEALA